MRDAVNGQQVRDTLMRRYESALLDNIYRGDYVECLVALSLGIGWELTWVSGWDWAAWDIEHESGARIEAKQSAARQRWDRTLEAPIRRPRFDIAPREGFWTRDGNAWMQFQEPSRPADIYVLAWHGERQNKLANHCDPLQWQFFVVPEKRLPKSQKSIGLAGIERIALSCRINELRDSVMAVWPQIG